MATVSRVLNGLPGVRPRTVEQVMEAVDRLGYQPNLLGRNLRRNETKVILVLVSTVANTLVSKVISGIEQTGRGLGYSILICATNDDPACEAAYLDLLRNRFADGAIIMSTLLGAAQLSDLGRRHSVVQCCEYLPDTGVPYAAIDNRRAAYEAVTYLIQNGCKRIAYMGVKNHLLSSSERFNGYVQALSEHGIPLDRSLIADGNYGFRSAIRLMNKFLKKDVIPDGLFAISDRMAAGAIRAAKDMGISIPGDLQVVGFDNTDISYISEPGITTVSQSPIEMGSEAMQLMAARIQGQDFSLQKEIGHKIIVRSSTNTISHLKSLEDQLGI